MKTISASKSSSHPHDFTVAVHVNPGDTYEWSTVLLARASFNGTFELLTAAWERLLGYGREEFVGKTLGKLVSRGTAPVVDASRGRAIGYPYNAHSANVYATRTANQPA